MVCCFVFIRMLYYYLYSYSSVEYWISPPFPSTWCICWHLSLTKRLSGWQLPLEMGKPLPIWLYVSKQMREKQESAFVSSTKDVHHIICMWCSFARSLFQAIKNHTTILLHWRVETSQWNVTHTHKLLFVFVFSEIFAAKFVLLNREFYFIQRRIVYLVPFFSYVKNDVQYWLCQCDLCNSH